MGNLIRYYDSISTVYSGLINLTISFHTKKIIKFLAGVAVYVAVEKQKQLFPKAISQIYFHYNQAVRLYKELCLAITKGNAHLSRKLVKYHLRFF